MKNITSEQIRMAHALGDCAEQISNLTEGTPLRFMWDFSFGVYEKGAMVMRLSVEEERLTLADFSTIELFEGDNYEKASKAMYDALTIAKDGGKSARLAYYEAKIKEIQG